MNNVPCVRYVSWGEERLSYRLRNGRSPRQAGVD